MMCESEREPAAHKAHEHKVHNVLSSSLLSNCARHRCAFEDATQSRRGVVQKIGSRRKRGMFGLCRREHRTSMIIMIVNASVRTTQKHLSNNRGFSGRYLRRGFLCWCSKRRTTARTNEGRVVVVPFQTENRLACERSHHHLLPIQIPDR